MAVPARLGRMLRTAATGPLIGLVQLYRYGISPLLPGACRFEPSCSAYALEALGRHGALTGLWLTARRVARCHPWGGHGYDPVPERHGAHARAAAPCPAPLRDGGEGRRPGRATGASPGAHHHPRIDAPPVGGGTMTRP